MISHLTQGFSAIASLTILGTILGGSLIGILGGAIPGLSAAGTIAIVTPLTFGMSPLISLALLAAIYTGAQYGGSITATLLNTPGAPESAVMVLDGHTMTKQGRAGEALWAAIIAGVIGGLISTIILVAAATPLAKEALNFGPAEYFTLVLFGLSVLASLSEGSILKGIIVTVAGLAITVIGLDPITGQSRYTFGVPQLLDGVPVVPVLIGLFATSEGLVLLRSLAGTPERPPGTVRLFGSFPRGRAMRKIIRFGLLGTAIGTVIGIKPGGGATIASLVAYSVAKQVSSNPEEFGKGAVEGLITPEAADKATVGAALIPLLVLGLPASASTAVLIGAFTIHGVVPGPLLFRDSGPLVYGIMASLFVANLCVMLLGIAGMRPLTRVGGLPPRRLGVIILVTTFVGSYIAVRDISGVWFALVFGIIGYGLKRYHFPVAPMVLALVLGPLLESNLRRALIIANGDPTTFVTRPISAVLVGLTVIAFGLPPLLRLFRGRRVRHRGAVDAPATKEQEHSGT